MGVSCHTHSKESRPEIWVPPGRRRDIQVGDRVYLRVSPIRGVKRFGVKGRLAPCFVGPYKVLERMGEVSYKLEFPEGLSGVHDVFHVSQLRRCFSDPSRGVDHEMLDLQDNLTYQEYPVRILDQAERTTRRHNIKFLKVQWSHHSEKEATWEREDRQNGATIEL